MKHTDNCWVVKESISSSYDKRETVLLDRIDGEGNSHTGEELPEEILKLSKDYQYSYLGSENYILGKIRLYAGTKTEKQETQKSISCWKNLLLQVILPSGVSEKHAI